MRVKSVSVKKLFGVFDHEIPLQSAERVTIIHGPNGFGKTVMLRMIQAIAEGNTSIFEVIPFDEFRLTLDDGTARVIRRGQEADAHDRKISLEILVVDEQGHETATPQLQLTSGIPKSVLDRVDRHVPPPYQRFGNGWRDDAGRQYLLVEILERFPRAKTALPPKYRQPLFPDSSKRLDVYFVETNRLEGSRDSSDDFDEEEWMRHERLGAHPTMRPDRIRPRVEQYSEDLLQRLKSVLADYAKHSQERDRTFPERLVQFVRSEAKVLSERDILDRMVQLETKRRRLISIGFLDSESGLRDLTEEDVRRTSEALTIYVGDVQEKLRVFDEMAAKVGKLMDVVNDRFNYKRLTIHRERGFDVRSDADKILSLKDLSSGEQHELVLLYELLFRTPKNGLVLVDEPEISFHVAWQSGFLNDLIGILELTDAYAIVATHSPVIIGPRWDLAVELSGPK